MSGFNMELDSVQTELDLLEHSLATLVDAARLDGVIDAEEQADIDALEAVIAETRLKISEMVAYDAPPEALAAVAEPGTPEHDAEQQAAQALNEVAESRERARRDAEERAAREEEARARAKAEAEIRGNEKASALLQEAGTRAMTLDDLKDLPPASLERLYRDLKALRKGDDDWVNWFVLAGNIGAVKGVLTAVSGPVIDKDDMEADARRLMSIVQEHWVDDGDEAEMMGIIEYYAQSPETMDAFFTELDNHHYWGGVFDEKYTPLLTALKRELEGGNGRRFVELMNSAKSERIRNYEDPEEVTFSGVLWEDVKSGAARDQIFAYFKGIGDAGVGIVEGAYDTAVMVKDMTYLLVTDPDEFKRKLSKVPDTVKMFWKNREAIYKHMIDSFMNASPEEQARMIGRIVGELELFLATMPAAGAKAADTATDVGRGVDALADTARIAETLDDVGDAGRVVDSAGDAARIADGLDDAGDAGRAVDGLGDAARGADEVGDAAQGGGRMADKADDAVPDMDGAGGGGGRKPPDDGADGLGGEGPWEDNPFSDLTDAEIDAAFENMGAGPLVRAPAEDLALRLPGAKGKDAVSMNEGYWSFDGGDMIVQEYRFQAQRGMPRLDPRGNPIPGDPGNVKTRMRIHSADPTAPPGSKSNTDWTVSFEQGNARMTADGNWFDTRYRTAPDGTRVDVRPYKKDHATGKWTEREGGATVSDPDLLRLLDEFDADMAASHIPLGN